MTKIKLNDEDSYEHLCIVRLTEEKFPRAYAAKLDELVNRSGMDEKKARDFLNAMPIELGLYYSPDFGCFAVETDAVDNGARIFDPYTGEECEPIDEE